LKSTAAIDGTQNDCNIKNCYTWGIAKTPAKKSAYEIPSVIVLFVILVFKVWFVSFIPKATRGFEPYYLQRSVSEPSLLNVLVQLPNKIGLKKKKKIEKVMQKSASMDLNPST
jgi:hypothetical protein